MTTQPPTFDPTTEQLIDGGLDAAGNQRWIVAPLAGSPDANLAALQQKAQQAITQLEAAVVNWATLTAGQKDAALKLSVTATAKLCRLAVNQLDAS